MKIGENPRWNSDGGRFYILVPNVANLLSRTHAIFLTVNVCHTGLADFPIQIGHSPLHELGLVFWNGPFVLLQQVF